MFKCLRFFQLPTTRSSNEWECEEIYASMNNKEQKSRLKKLSFLIYKSHRLCLDYRKHDTNR